ncbi:MAG: hypothetical protein KJ583_03205 [Nanoarchaeota archaeon]|nr:hypothetical protein [Nanoarchaeota archaeon]MBU1269385.1 hypothetical protein [Nanoarchaeota archaeon]MBU1604302.1 hypothetical protein [Nanoarchaeota archaeon]MBU2443722.1 hypothetical protein [Nanoarchaeota archaeon]
MDEDDLIDIGFGKNEAKAYLAIAELGPTAIGPIAKLSKIHRVNVYDAVEGLLKKGLISYIQKGKTKSYQITEPANFLNLLKEKEEKIKNIIPKIALLKQLANNNEAEILEGLQAVKRFLDQTLEYGDTLLVMGIPSNVASLIGPFLPYFHRRRIDKKIVMKHIYNTDAHERIKVLKNMPYTEIKLLPSEYDSPITTFIVGKEVTFIHWSKNPLIIRIKSEKLADVYKKYYDVLWKNAKPVQ